MLTPWLPPPFPTQDILSIPDMMQHSPVYQPWIKKVKKKKKKLSSSPPVFLLGAEKPACSLEKDEETHVLLIALWSHWLCLVLSGSDLHLVSFQAMCCGGPLTVFDPEHVQYLLSPETDSSLRHVFSCKAARRYTLAFGLASWSACLASLRVCKPSVIALPGSCF